jgi:hypothetical protein
MTRDGGLVAWLRPGAKLHWSRLDRFASLTAGLEGECLDFAWHENDGIICLTRQNSWMLPGRFHATCRLERIDAATGETNLLAEFPAY